MPEHGTSSQTFGVTDRPVASSVRRSVGIDVGGTKTLGVLVERGPDGVVVVDREQLPSDAGRAESVDAIVAVARMLLDPPATPQ